MESLLWRLLVLTVCLHFFLDGGLAFKKTCHREPTNTSVSRSIGDGGFRITISGNPKSYVPGEVYTVTLHGETNQYLVQKFAGFTLVVESTSRFQNFAPHSVGTFQLYGDLQTMHSERCPNAVIQTSNILKSKVQVLWAAPPSGSGCLQFKATLIEQRDIWFMDDGELSKELCEEIQDNEDEQPQMIAECCPCNEAKYEVTFEGLWSRQTHPKDFPANEWLTHFSDIIGASHSNDYRVWEYGEFASDGLRQLAEWGSTRSLESELKRESDHIRTIIKARGLWYPNVNGKTFAVFRVDNRHHLMSLVSMLGPSPDWIVGVSALELCSKNCSWVAQKTLNLYPWDAGTDSGATYISTNNPTVSRQKIRRITNSYPNDPKNPFYDPKGLPMKPLARLTVTRQRVYEKTCTGTALPDDDFSYEITDSERPECAATEWSEYSPCSATCGEGLHTRRREYKIPLKADMFRCQRQLEETKMCPAPIPICDHYSAQEKWKIGNTTRKNAKENIAWTNKSLRRKMGDVENGKESPTCQTTEWSPWTPCLASCGEGIMTRSRRYMDRLARKKCNKQLIQKKICMADIQKCERDDEEINPECAVTPWTNWSPCSVTCGKGVRSRSRYFLNPSTMTEASCGVQTISKMTCEGERKKCTIDESEAKEVCLQKRKVGPCRGYFPRWYYDVQKGVCVQFVFGGCRGNRNNFNTHDECTRMCEVSGVELHPDPNANNNYSLDSTVRSKGGDISWNRFPLKNRSKSSKFGGLSPESQLGAEIDCIMSPWNDWSSCSVTCGHGWREKRRMVKVASRNGGKDCPKKKVKRRKCKLTRCSK